MILVDVAQRSRQFALNPYHVSSNLCFCCSFFVTSPQILMKFLQVFVFDLGLCRFAPNTCMFLPVFFIWVSLCHIAPIPSYFPSGCCYLCRSLSYCPKSLSCFCKALLSLKVFVMSNQFLYIVFLQIFFVSIGFCYVALIFIMFVRVFVVSVCLLHIAPDSYRAPPSLCCLCKTLSFPKSFSCSSKSCASEFTTYLICFFKFLKCLDPQFFSPSFSC